MVLAVVVVEDNNSYRVGNSDFGGEQKALSLEPPDGLGIDPDRAHSARPTRQAVKAVSLCGLGHWR